MTTLEERITALEDEIAEYRVKLNAATTEAAEERYANLITASRNNLTALLQQQQQQQGNYYPPPDACQFNTAALKLFLSLGSPLISPSRSCLTVI